MPQIVLMLLTLTTFNVFTPTDLHSLWLELVLEPRFVTPISSPMAVKFNLDVWQTLAHMAVLLTTMLSHSVTMHSLHWAANNAIALTHSDANKLLVAGWGMILSLTTDVFLDPSSWRRTVTRLSLKAPELKSCVYATVQDEYFLVKLKIKLWTFLSSWICLAVNLHKVFTNHTGKLFCIVGHLFGFTKTLWMKIT